ncbi:hypothetical protein TKK_0004566 [Trichogramma kaykai]
MSGESNDDDDDNDDDENNDDNQPDPARLAEQIKHDRRRYNRDAQIKRELFLEEFYHSIGAFKNRPFPQLRDIYTAAELDQLLLDAVEHDGCFRVWRRIVPFVARSGHKHEPELDDAGKPLLRRTTPIHRAARRRLKEVIPHLFEIYDGLYDANYVDGAGVTHFHLACKFGQFEACARFLASANSKVDVNAPTGAGDRPLHLALSSPSDLRLIELLLRAGADPNRPDSTGATALHLICRKYSSESARRLFELSESCGRPMDVDAPGVLGRTPLHATLILGGTKADVVDFLLRHGGANPNLATNDGSTALHILCGKGRPCDVVLARLLFRACRREHLPLKLDARDKEGDTPLHVAARRGHQDMVTLLLEMGAHPNLANVRGFTPLHLICTREAVTGRPSNGENYAVAQTFYRGCVGRGGGGGGGGGGFDFVDARDANGNTAMHLAVSKNDIALVSFLLEHGADPNARNKFGSTPLHVFGERSQLFGNDWTASFFGMILLAVFTNEGEARRKILRGRKTITRQYYRPSLLPAWAIALLVGIAEILVGVAAFFILRKIFEDKIHSSSIPTYQPATMHDEEV